jgi:hypothetical protein
MADLFVYAALDVLLSMSLDAKIRLEIVTRTARHVYATRLTACPQRRAADERRFFD